MTWEYFVGMAQVDFTELKEVHGVWQRVCDTQCVEKGRKEKGSCFWQALEVIAMIKTFHRRGHGFLRIIVQSVK